MPNANDIDRWMGTIRSRYENYLKTSFYFKDRGLRQSFQSSLQEEGSLLKGPYPEQHRSFKKATNARELARQCFPHGGEDLLPALISHYMFIRIARSEPSIWINVTSSLPLAPPVARRRAFSIPFCSSCIASILRENWKNRECGR